MLNTLEIVENLEAFEIRTANGITYVIPGFDASKEIKSLRLLENFRAVKQLADGYQIKNVRYIEDSVRPVLLVEIG